MTKGTDRKTFKVWFEKKIFKMQAGKGYKKITLTYNQYKKDFANDTGNTVSLRTMERAVTDLMKEDKIRKEWKVFKVDGEYKGKYMHICLGYHSRFWGLLRKLALEAKEKTGKAWKQANKGLSQLFIPHIPSYNDIMMWKWGSFTRLEADPVTVWIEPTPPDPSQKDLTWKEYRKQFQSLEK